MRKSGRQHDSDPPIQPALRKRPWLFPYKDFDLPFKIGNIPLFFPADFGLLPKVCRKTKSKFSAPNNGTKKEKVEKVGHYFDRAPLRLVNPPDPKQRGRHPVAKKLKKVAYP